jgi:hypothetical protein
MYGKALKGLWFYARMGSGDRKAACPEGGEMTPISTQGMQSMDNLERVVTGQGFKTDSIYYTL